MFLFFLRVELSYGTSADKCMVFWGWFPHLKSKFHCAIMYYWVVKSFRDFVQSTIISKFGTLVLHIYAEKPVRLDFRNLYYFFFSWFYVWKFRVNMSQRIYSGTLRVETSRCRWRISLPGKHANIARSWDLFPKYASSTHFKSKTTAYIHIYVLYKYPLKQNCHIFRPIRREEHVVWQPVLSLCAIPFNGIPLLVICIPRSANQFNA